MNETDIEARDRYYAEVFLKLSETAAERRLTA